MPKCFVVVCSHALLSYSYYNVMNPLYLDFSVLLSLSQYQDASKHCRSQKGGGPDVLVT